MSKNYFNGKNGVYIIAEIGGNHEGNFEYAKYLTNLAAQSGADAVKFQIYSGKSLVNKKYDLKRFNHFNKFQLSKDQYLHLAQLCKRLGVQFMASVWDLDAVEYIDKYIKVYKVGSGDLTSYNIIKKFLLTNKPIIISTGLSNFKDVENCVDFIRNTSPNHIKQKKIAILQCTSMYPIPNKDANLNVINSFKNNFNLPIGYSDHTEGTKAIEVAVAMGAKVIEVHFTDSREGKVFRDHKVSLTKDEIVDFIKHIKLVKTLQGSPNKKPTKSEIENNHIYSFRRGIYASKNLKLGHILNEKDIVTLRPLQSASADNFYKILGMKLTKSIKKNQSIDLSSLKKID